MGGILAATLLSIKRRAMNAIYATLPRGNPSRHTLRAPCLSHLIWRARADLAAACCSIRGAAARGEQGLKLGHEMLGAELCLDHVQQRLAVCSSISNATLIALPSTVEWN